MDIIVSIASPIAKRQFGYIISYQENLQKLKTAIRRLEGTKANVQHSVAEGERNGEMIEANVQDWLKEVNDTIVEANKLVDIEGDAEERCCMGLFPNPWTRSQLSKRFEEMIEKIFEGMKNGKFDRISYRVPFEVISSPSDRGYEALNSRTTVLNEIREALQDPKNFMIGVYGMGGVGKTSLMNELAWQVRKDNSFGVVAIALITPSPDVKKIQDQIVEAIVGRKLEQQTNKELRKKELCEMIRAQKKRVLIILDDVWSELDLIEVGIPFGDELDSCKLVVTSRDLNVLTKMGTQKEINLGDLQEEDSWILFQKMVGDVVKKDEIKPIAKQVAKCCAGLPLYISVVAKGLRKKDVHAWKVALIQLKGFNHKELEKNVHPALKLSYDSLDKDELKSLFLFIGSFGINEIHTEDLFLCCWGLGFYEDKQTLIEARDIHYTLINDLRASSLLLEGKPEWVQMHDVVRDLAKSIAFTSGFHLAYAIQRLTRMEEWPKIDELQKFHYIIIHSSYNIQELPEKLECPKLKLLLLRYKGLGQNLKVTNNFFSGMKGLRTLELYRMAFSPSIPSSLHFLINLRSLNLSGCDLGDIRIVAKLTNLEILILERSNIKDLPKDISHLTHLRLLNLSHCYELKVIPANLISSLRCLEELYMRDCYIQWEVEGRRNGSNNASLSELQKLDQLTTLEISIEDASILPWDLQFSTNLERYNIIIGVMWRYQAQKSGDAPETSRTLKLIGSGWTIISLSTIEDLSFAELDNVNDGLSEINVEGFPQLKHLYIENSDKLLYIINSSIGLVNPHSAFPKLESLVLECLDSMEEICHGPLPSQSFARLKVIKVNDCHRLRNLFYYSMVGNLSQLHEMKISHCEDMIEIIASEKQEDEQEVPNVVLPELHSLKLSGLPMLLSFYLPLTIDKGNPSIKSTPTTLLNQQVMMPKLETLELHYMDTCKIWDDKFSVYSCIQNLTHLIVSGCDRLTSLFSFWVARALVKLQLLKVSQCSMLKEIFVQEREVQFPNLETLYIIQMKDLKSIWPNQVAPNSFCKLKEIHIENCESLDYVFPISLANELQQLQDLTINDCAIKSIVEKSDSSEMTQVHLEKLSVWNCHSMKTIISSFVQFQTLVQLEVYGCDGMINIITPSTTNSLPKLRILSISGCHELEEIYGSKNKSIVPLGEVAFMKLEEMRLENLPRLTSFCQGSYDFKFGSLQMVYLIQCPMMDTFYHGNLTTPNHTKVHYE